MKPMPCVSLYQEHAGQVQGMMQRYRASVLEHLAPSTERNVHLRLLQGLQGRLLEGAQQETLHLELSGEEVQALKQMMVVVESWEHGVSAEERSLLRDLALRLRDDERVWTHVTRDRVAGWSA